VLLQPLGQVSIFLKRIANLRFPSKNKFVFREMTE
jgi:hypothetical protein